MKNRRVVITGLGVIAPNGIGKAEFWQAIKTGKSGIKKISSFDVSKFPCQVAGEVTIFDPSQFITPKEIRRTDRASQFAIAASTMAKEDSKVSLSKKDRIGVSIGSAVGGYDWIFKQHKVLLTKGPLHMHPFTVLVSFPNVCSAYVAATFHLEGPAITFSNGCPSSFNAIGYAINLIQQDKVDIMFSGGTDAPILEPILDSFCAAKVISTKYKEVMGSFNTPRPFDKERDGLILAEGSAMFVLEEMEHAIKRGARIYSEILSYAESCDGYNLAIPEPTAASKVRCIENAIKYAGINKEEIGYISAHGTATAINDENETLALKKVFGDYAYKIPISAIKSMIGHGQAASSAIELLASILALDNSLLPPTINYKTPDPKCDLDYIPNTAREKKVNIALLNSFGFGGKNANIIIKKHKD